MDIYRSWSSKKNSIKTFTRLIKFQTIKKIVFVFTSLSLLISCQNNHKQLDSPKTKPIPLVKVQAARRTKMVSYIEVTGTIQANVFTDVKSPADGIIEVLHVRENQIAEKGKIVAVINPEERLALIAGNQLEIEKLELQLVKENKDSENYHRLTKSLIQANENLEYAKNMYQAVPVICPMNGLVTQRWLEQGAQVSVREKIITITDMGSLVVKAEVNEKYFEVIKQGNILPVTLNAYPKDTLRGKITLVYPQVDPVTRSIKFDIKILNSNKTLLPGMMAFLKIPVSVRENAVSVPEHAVLTSPDNKYFLFVVDKNSIVNRRVIETGISAGNKLEIKKGISENEKVIVAGQEMLKDSMKVKLLGSSKGGKK